MVAPAVLILSALVLYPLVSLLVMSLRDYGTGGNTIDFDWVGLKWYAMLTSDHRFVRGLLRSIQYSLGSVSGALVLGLGLAMLLNRNYRGIGVLRVLFILPYTTMMVAIALLWNIMLNPANGIMNYFLQAIGLPASLWLADTRTVLPTLIMIQIWRSTPFAMLIALAGLRSMPLDSFEAADIDGASPLQKFRYLTLPMLRSALATAALFMLIDTLKQFPLIYVLTGGGPLRASETLYIYGYNLTFRFFDIGYGSAALVALLLLVLTVSVIWLRVRERSWL
ncbi:MAG: sugar ABC transporter permease [Trueperaceae bacterium]